MLFKYVLIQYPLPTPETQHWTNFVRLDRKNLKLIRNVLEGKNKHHYMKYRWMKKVKNYYKQCRERDSEPLKYPRKFVKKLLHHTPGKLHKKHLHNRKNLAKTLANIFAHYGFDVFFHIQIGINDKNSTIHVIKIDQPTLTYPHNQNYNNQNATKTTLNREYLMNYMRTIFKLVYKKYPSKSRLKSIIEIEYEIGIQEIPPR